MSEIIGSSLLIVVAIIVVVLGFAVLLLFCRGIPKLVLIGSLILGAILITLIFVYFFRPMPDNEQEEIKTENRTAEVPGKLPDNETVKDSVVSVKEAVDNKKDSIDTNDIFVKAFISKKVTKVNTPVEFTLKLYAKHNVSLSSLKVLVLPLFEGFKEERIDLEEKEQKLTEVQYYNNEKYSVVTLLKYSLIPESTGNFELPSQDILLDVEYGIPSSKKTKSFFDEDNVMIEKSGMVATQNRVELVVTD